MNPQSDTKGKSTKGSERKGKERQGLEKSETEGQQVCFFLSLMIFQSQHFEKKHWWFLEKITSVLLLHLDAEHYAATNGRLA